MRLKDTKTVKAMIDRMNAQIVDYNDLANKPTINGVTVDGTLTSADLGLAAAQEDIVLEGQLTWLQGGSFNIEGEEDVAKLKQYEDLALDGKHPRFGIHFSYNALDYKMIKEADMVHTYTNTSEDEEPRKTFNAHFTFYAGEDQSNIPVLYGVTLYRAYNVDWYELIIVPISLTPNQQ